MTRRTPQANIQGKLDYLKMSRNKAAETLRVSRTHFIGFMAGNADCTIGWYSAINDKLDRLVAAEKAKRRRKRQKVDSIVGTR